MSNATNNLTPVDWIKGSDQSSLMITHRNLKKGRREQRLKRFVTNKDEEISANIINTFIKYLDDLAKSGLPDKTRIQHQ